MEMTIRRTEVYGPMKDGSWFFVARYSDSGRLIATGYEPTKTRAQHAADNACDLVTMMERD